MTLEQQFIVPERHIKEVFAALSRIAVIFASNGPGLMDKSLVLQVEQHYMRYRESYNSRSYEELLINGFLYGFDCFMWESIFH